MEVQVVEDGLRVEVGSSPARSSARSKAELAADDAIAQRPDGESVHGHEDGAVGVTEGHCEVALHRSGGRLRALGPNQRGPAAGIACTAVLDRGGSVPAFEAR